MQDNSELIAKLKEKSMRTAEISKVQLVEFARYIEKEKRDNPRAVVQIICDAVINPDDVDENPLAFAFRLVGKDEYTAPFRRFAALLRDAAAGTARSSVNGYTSFSNVVARWFEFENIEYELSRTVLIDAENPKLGIRDIGAIPFALFRAYSGMAGSAIDSVAAYVNEGLPLYRRGPQDAFEILPDTDALYQYIAKKGEFAETGAISSIPNWTEEVFFKEADFEVHKLYFWGSEDLPTDALAARRAALRSALGSVTTSRPVVPSPSVGRTHSTKLLGIVQAVIERYYGPQFEDGNVDTVPRQKDVMEWVMQTFDLSKREADSVDVVTRPDFARK